MNCLSGVVVDTSDELVSSITQVVNQFLNGKCPKILGEYFARAPLTMLVKSGGGIHPIVVGIVWRCLVSKVSVVVIGHSLDGYLNDLQYGVGVSGRGEAILHHIVTASGPGFGKMGVEACHLTLRIREACSFMLCDLDFEPLSLSLSSLPSCDLVSLTNILILCLILKASNQS
ncbi:hypothetical protein Tco_0648945 [Tanacetum coccineum]